MLLRPLQCRRRGAVSVEAAFCYPILMLLIFGVVILGLGAYRNEQVASLARLGSRYACVHGSDYATAMSSTAKTEAQIKTYVTARAVGLDLSKLTVTVWLEKADGTVDPWDSSTKTPTDTTTGKKNTVKVIVTYSWVPEALPIMTLPTTTLSSTSKVPMSF